MDGVDLQSFSDPRPVAWPWPAAGELPEEAPLDMPVQSLRGVRLSKRRPATSPLGIGLRRALLIEATFAATLAGGSRIGRVLMQDDLGPLDVAIILVFACLFAWITFWLVTAAMGFLEMLRRKPCALDVDPAAPAPQVTSRTAILAPIYNEETRQVFARLQAAWESLQATGQGLQFDLFVLSDSTDAAIQAAELHAFELLRSRLPEGAGVYYRHRRENIERKAGNIAEWVRRFGAAYSFMVVLDADSLMTGDTLVRLAGAMEAHPDVGLVQTLPRIVNRASLLGRAIQFASRLYGPVLARGLAWWSGAEGNYWGHNAIIRTRAFAEAAGLPSLKGAKPFGGPIMSHDFVEAALIRRAGWGVHMVPELDGSYEECPPTLAALIQRDRRWCQGNLQHLRILNASGLHWTSRMHLLTGALAYLTAPLWLLLLTMSVVLPLLPGLGEGVADMMDKGAFSLQHDLAAVGWLFVISMSFLIAPKLFGYVVALADRGQRQAFGGARRMLAGVGLEILLSMLIAPVMMLSQTQLILDLALGRDAGWAAQPRAEEGFGLKDAARCHGWHTGVGLVLSGLAWCASPAVFLWLSPVLLGLLLSIPISFAVARRELGLAARRRGLLVTPEEARLPDIVARANRLVAAYPPPAAPAAPACARPGQPADTVVVRLA